MESIQLKPTAVLTAIAASGKTTPVAGTTSAPSTGSSLVEFITAMQRSESEEKKEAKVKKQAGVSLLEFAYTNQAHLNQKYTGAFSDVEIKNVFPQGQFEATA